MGWEVGASFKREGTHVYPWLIHVAVWQKPTQHCKAIIFQLKIDKFKRQLKKISIYISTKNKILRKNITKVYKASILKAIKKTGQRINFKY